MEVLNLDGSGSYVYLRPNLFTRPAVQSSAQDWGLYQPPVNVYKVGSVTWEMPQHTRYLSSDEQRVFRMALRRGVRIIYRGGPRE